MQQATKYIFAILIVSCASYTFAAIPVNGSMGLSLNSMTQDGADLSTSTVISIDSLNNNGSDFGHYIPVPLLEGFGGASLDLTLAPTGFGFGIVNLGYASFTATSGSIVSQSASVLDLYLLGNVTPYSGILPADEVTESSMRITINQNGQSLSGGATLSSPALPDPTVPEPATLVLVGGGLAALLVSRRKR